MHVKRLYYIEMLSRCAVGYSGRNYICSTLSNFLIGNSITIYIYIYIKHSNGGQLNRPAAKRTLVKS